MPASAINTCTISVFLADFAGSVPTIDPNNPPKFVVNNGRSFIHGNNAITPFTQETNFNVAGEASMDVIETESVGEELEFSILMPEGVSTRTIAFESAIVPDAASKDLSEITVVKPLDFG